MVVREHLQGKHYTKINVAVTSEMPPPPSMHVDQGLTSLALVIDLGSKAI